MRAKTINDKKQSGLISSVSRMINEMMKPVHDQIVIWIVRFAGLNQRFSVQVILLASLMKNMHLSQNDQGGDHLAAGANTLYSGDIITIIWIRHTKRFSWVKCDH